MTLHDDIDTYLAADLHNELSADEQNKLHAHLVECATCRKLHQETKAMNKILEENLAAEKADPTFEQRMLASFRNRIPQRSGGLTKLIFDLMRLRSAQVTAVAAVLFGLVQVGRMVTGEGAAPARKLGYRDEHHFADRQLNAPFQRSADHSSAQASQLAAGRADALIASEENSFASAPAAPMTQGEKDKIIATEDRREFATKMAKAASAEAALAAQAKPAETPAVVANRKLIRNANV